MPEKAKITLNALMLALSRILPWVILLHTLLFILYWMTNQLYHHEVNAFLAKTFNQPLNYIAIFFGFSLLVLLGSLLVLRLAAHPLYVRLYTLLAGIYLVFFYASFAALFWQDPTQLSRLYLLIHYFRLLPDALLLLALAWLAGRWALPVLANHMPQFTALLLVFGFQSAAWGLPLLRQPGNVYVGHLPTRPRLIAHRGAAWLAPENTLAAMQRAKELDVFGLESDVNISLDGVPFLMHDATLQRTTDVAAIFPQRAANPASSFTWSELQQLNAGSWFTDQDPYGSIKAGLVSASAVESYAQDGIPSLQTFLAVASQSQAVVLYDLYDPPQGHPYHDLALQRSLEALCATRLDERAWILATPDEIAQIRQALPKATLVAGIASANPPPASELLAQGYQVVNSEYPLSDQAIRAYRKAGLWVNLWTVDEPWQYSRLWLLDADSVTSNNVHTLSTLEQPVLALPFIRYLPIWATVGLLAALVLFSSGSSFALKSW